MSFDRFPWNPVGAPLVGALFGSKQTKTWSLPGQGVILTGRHPADPGCRHREGDHKGRPYDPEEKNREKFRLEDQDACHQVQRP